MSLSTLINNFRRIDFSKLETYQHLLYKYQDEDWKKYINLQDRNYGRELIHRDKNFEMFLLSWNGFQRSKIHNHAKMGCLMKVLEGELTETLYTKQLNPLKNNTYSPGETSYIDDTIGYHKISNNSYHSSFSLHIYSPPQHNTQYFL